MRRGALLSLLLAASAACATVCAAQGAAQPAPALEQQPVLKPTPELLTDSGTPAARADDQALLAALDRGQFAQGRYAGTAGALPYRLLSPSPLQPGRRYPLVIVLHGSGAIGSDNASQLGQLAMSWAAPAIRQRFPAYILVPQFAERSANYAPSAADGLLAAQPGPGLPALPALVDSLLPQYAIDARRVYITGFSMGASAATQAMLQKPAMFAAGVTFSGIPPERAAAARLSGTPLLIVHGNADTENPIDADRAMFAALRRLPGTNVRFVEYQGMQHQVPADMLLSPAWRDWLFAQQRPH